MTDLDRLREAHAAIPDPDPAAVERARTRLRSRTRVPSPPRPRRRLLMAPAVAAVAVAAAVALFPASRTGTDLAPDAATAAIRACSDEGAAARCTAALGVLAGADGRALTPDEVLYRRDLSFDRITYVQRSGRPGLRPDPQGFGVAGGRSVELWLTPAGRGRITYGAPTAPVLPSPADRRGWIGAGRPDLERLLPPPGPGAAPPAREFTRPAANETLLGAGGLNAVLPRSGDPLRALSSDPAVLERQLLRLAWRQRTQVSGDAPCSPDLRDCSPATRRNIRDLHGSNITTLLRYPLAAADLRRALLTVLGRVAGTRRLGVISDPVGRQAAAVQLPAGMNAGRDVVLFDLRQGRLVADGISAGANVRDTLRFTNAYDIELRAVGRVGERPDGPGDRRS